MELKITEFKAFTAQANFEWTFVRVYAGDLYGTGEAGPAPGLAEAAKEFKGLLVGEDAFKVNRIEQKPQVRRSLLRDLHVSPYLSHKHSDLRSPRQVPEPPDLQDPGWGQGGDPLLR